MIPKADLRGERLKIKVIVKYVREAIHSAHVNPTKLVVLIPSCSHRVLPSRITRIEQCLKIPNIIQEPITLMSSIKGDKLKGLFAEKLAGHLLVLHFSRNGQPIPDLGTISQYQKVTGANNKVSPELIKYLTDPSICLVTVSKDINFSLAPNVYGRYIIVVSTIVCDGSEVQSGNPYRPSNPSHRPLNPYRPSSPSHRPCYPSHRPCNPSKSHHPPNLN